jgi:hypothetical protein
MQSTPIHAIINGTLAEISSFFRNILFLYKAYGIEIPGGQCLTLFCSGRINPSV